MGNYPSPLVFGYDDANYWAMRPIYGGRIVLLEIILTLTTLTVAVIGTLLKDPTKRVKQFLIGLAFIASLASIIEAVGDASDKEFMKTALTSTLTPSTAS